MTEVSRLIVEVLSRYDLTYSDYDETDYSDLGEGRISGEEIIAHDIATRLRKNLTQNSAVGMPIDANDKNGNPICVGDTLDFDEKEWGGEFKPEQILIENCEVLYSGSYHDFSQYRQIVKKWYE